MFCAGTSVNTVMNIQEILDHQEKQLCAAVGGGGSNVCLLLQFFLCMLQ
jgi:hypothetical protein